jgi:hypothetical protein
VRSPAEIAFRLRQELGNLYLWAKPPDLKRIPAAPKPPQGIERLRSSRFAAEVTGLADEILLHRFPIFGGVIDTGPEIHWRRDYVHGVESGLSYFRSIPYLDVARVGDHKNVWELNRHQHLVILAQAWYFTENLVYLEEAQRELKSWIAANPFLQGINWTSALEVAMRALSWVWLDRLAGEHMAADRRHVLLVSLYQHGCFLEHNLSIYFSPNTHLLGEAVALHTLGVSYPEFPHSARWRALGAELVEEQMQKQVHDDGAHFEQSAYYHVYALDFFLWHALLAETPARYQEKLVRMAEYLDALTGAAGRIPAIGDEDGGRVFHPYGDRSNFGRATLATCGVRFGRPEWIRTADDLTEQAAWWLGPEARDKELASQAEALSRLFPDSGMAVMTGGDVQIVVKAGGFGPATAGHSHSDALSLVCRQGTVDLLVDSGTYTYLANPKSRDWFRGSGAHNTIRIDERDQAIPAGPFRWEGRPVVRIRQWSTSAERDFLDAECVAFGFRHRRRLSFVKPDLLVVLDRIEGLAGDHLVQQFWHAAAPEVFEHMAFSHPAKPANSWRSVVYGSKEETWGRCAEYHGTLPVTMAAVVSFGESTKAVTLDEDANGSKVMVHYEGRSLTVAV